MSTAIELDPVIYELIGRVIVETAVLEGRLIELAIRLDWQADKSAVFEDLQARHGGSHGGRLTKTAQDLGQAMGAGLDQAAFADFIRRVADRQSERNTIAHDLLFPLLGVGPIGFRTVPKTQRSGADEVTQFAILPQERLEEDLLLVKEVSREAFEWVARLPCPPFRGAAADPSD